MAEPHKEEKIPWPRPIIGVPLERAISHADKVFWPFISIAQQGWPFMQVPYGRTDLVRNKMAQHLLASHFTHVVMLDVDHVHPENIVQRLMANFIKFPDLKVVSGLNFRRCEPYDPCMFVRGDDGKFYPVAEWEKGGLIKVDALGTGSIAIAREVFEMIEPPWFYNDYRLAMDDVWPGEDMGFSVNCHKAGIDLFVDTTITSPHLIDAVVDEGAFRMYMQDKQLESIPLESVRKDIATEAK